MPGPNQGEQIHARTQERDAMFGRMAAMTVLKQPTSFEPLYPAHEKPLVPRQDEARKLEGFPLPSGASFQSGRYHVTNHGPDALIINPSQGSVLEAVGGGEVRAVIEDVLRTYSNIGPAGATPDHQWRAAEHFRPFHAVEALTQAMEKLIHERVQLSLRAVARAAPDDGAS